MTESDRTRAYLRLTLADGVGPTLIRRLVAEFGSPGEVVRAAPHHWQRVKGIGAKAAAALATVTDEAVDDELREAEKHRTHILCVDDEAYPKALKHIGDPPVLLYVRGALVEADALALAVVGARRGTHYGLEQAGRFGQLFARAGFTVVSGGARGIDAAAHHGALVAGGRTIAVMGCGLSKTYPPENAKLFEQIVAEGRGAVVSELPMRFGVLSKNFPRRNRIISGLSLGVLVVEAARRSGSLVTARLALEHNREVFALPGRVDSPTSQGTNELIRQSSAALVQNLNDVLEALGQVGQTVAEEHPDAVAPPAPAIDLPLDDAERLLLSALSEQALTLDELVRRTELASGKVASTMTMLVLKGLAEQRPGNVFVRRRRTR